MGYRSTRLWKDAFEPRAESEELGRPRARLANAFETFRERAKVMAGEIARTVPQLTDHSVDHLDALWDLADTIRGDTELNPAEVFALGGGILLHDLANATAAYDEGVEGLKGPEWNDLIHLEFLARHSRKPTDAELADPPPEIHEAVLLARLRQTHAQQAEVLARKGFASRSHPGTRTFLLEDQELREDLGTLIGKIAHSHHWDIDGVSDEFRKPRGSSPALPSSWTIDALKVALLLRTADACHIDSRRAPTVLMAMRDLGRASRDHWKFQNLLLRPTLHEEELIYTSRRPFSADERHAWWLAYETLVAIDRELRNADRVLRAEREFRFAARAVADVGSPESIADHIKPDGWVPIDARIQVSDVPAMVRQLGGGRLYSRPEAAVRELLANAADAIRARRVLEKRPADWGTIHVELTRLEKGWRIAINDEGIGMSERILRGPLLDFGASLWRSRLASIEHPGLLSSRFEPTGQFGIGFFSAFMLGQSVRVISRRFDADRKNVRILEFEGLENQRPILRQGRDSDLSPDINTSVQIDLDEGSRTIDGLLGIEDMGESDPDSIVQALARLVRRIAPAVDVNINATALDRPSSSCVLANDWCAIPFMELVYRLDPSIHFSRGLGPELLIARADRPLARVRFESSISVSGRGVSVVGGFSTLAGSRNHHGITVADSPNISRSEGRLVATPEECRAAVRSASVDYDLAWCDDWTDRRDVAQLMLNAGVRPQRLKCFILLDEFASPVEVREWLRGVSPGSSVVVVVENGFETYDAHDHANSNDFGRVMKRWRQPVGVVIAGGYGEGSFLGITARDPFLDVGTVDDLSCPNSLAAYILEMAREEWDGLIDVRTEDFLRVGELRDDPITCPVVVLKRQPSAS